MADQLVSAVGDQLMRAVIFSGIAALVVVGLVSLAWWQARRSIRRGLDSRAMANHSRSADQMDESRRPEAPAPDATGRRTAGSGERREDWSSRLVRDAAARAAAMRDAWDRSYRTARTEGTSGQPPRQPGEQLADLVAELRTTNDLLRDLITEMRARR